MGIRPTWFGATLVVSLVAGAVLAPSAADPQVAGLVGASIAAFVVLGVLWPVLAIVSTRVQVLASPTDVTVGDDLTLDVEVRGWAGPVAARLAAGRRDPAQEWHRIDVADRVGLAAVAPRRGVVDEVLIEMRTVAPLGIAAARRVHRCPLPATLWIAPEPTDESWVPTPNAARPLDGTSAASSPVGDVVRSVRPYQVGDPAHLVHWPSSARVGDLMVRELEPPAERGLAIVVHLGDDPARAEAIASQAAGFVWAVHASGGRIVLCTHQPDRGPRAVAVHTTVDAGRLLAAAEPGPPGSPPAGWPVVVVGP
jgi:uncharacterized protein (DUF58 family)